jgi:undecaprenyl-diphosphatase
MDIVLLFQAIIMGLVEGITEFLPVSSTGHLILAGELMQFWTPEKRDVFEVSIQMGAIVAVIFQYWGRLWGSLKGVFVGDKTSIRFTINLLVASIPAAVIGLLFGSVLKAYLFNVYTVAAAFIVGGFIILWAEKREHQTTVVDVDQLTLKKALTIGLIQCLAFIPGTSRSGATIIGSLFLGLSRTTATEFSFFLGIPVLFGAGTLDLYKHRHVFLPNDWLVVLVGGVVSFIAALIVIRALIRYVSQHDFTPFAWYRIAFGFLILLTSMMGWVNWSA